MAKILLVEDDNSLREIYQARLEAEGYETSSAQDGEEALVVAKQTKPDLVISDVMMPKISGFEMLDILRNTAGLEHVKVIMLTALGQTEDRNQADSLGADKYLVKSQVTLEDIVKTAHDLLVEDGVEEETPAADTEVSTNDAAPEAAAAPEPEPSVSTEPAPTEQPQTTVEPAPAPVPEPEPQPETQAAEEPLPAPAPEPQTNIPEPSPEAPFKPDPNDTQAQPAAAAPETEQAAAEQSANQSGSTAQEEDLVKSQIDEFVNSQDGQPTAAAPPAENPTPQAPAGPADNTAPQVSHEATDSAQPAAANTDQTVANNNADDELMKEAINQLSGEDGQGTDQNQPSSAEAPSEAAGRKVIAPLNNEPKPSVHDLLAKEDPASVDNAQTAVPGAPVTPDSTEGQPGANPLPDPNQQTPPNNQQPNNENNKPKDGFDPNNVAL